MKKTAVSLFLSAIPCFSLFTAIGCTDYYKVPESNCVVGLHKDYRLYGETGGGFCNPVDKKIKGVERATDYNYYSVIKGAEYTICIDGFIDNNDGWGWARKDDFFTNSAYWQGYIITGFEKEYYEKSVLRHERFFSTDFKDLNCNIAVSFDKNCTVKSVEEPYLNVGGIYETAQKGGNSLDSKVDGYLNTDGSINEKDGFYYLLLENEVCTHREAWKTNLDITNYAYEFFDYGLGSSVQANFSCKPLTVSENQELWLHIVCRTHSGKYFTQPVIYEGTTGFAVPVREHGLKLDFDFNKT